MSEKLLHFYGENDNVRVVFSKPVRVGLWFYQVASIMSSRLSYLLCLQLHDARQLDEGCLLVFAWLKCGVNMYLVVLKWTKK